jgi:hypothetical protein
MLHSIEVQVQVARSDTGFNYAEEPPVAANPARDAMHACVSSRSAESYSGENTDRRPARKPLGAADAWWYPSRTALLNFTLVFARAECAVECSDMR